MLLAVSQVMYFHVYYFTLRWCFLESIEKILKYTVIFLKIPKYTEKIPKYTVIFQKGKMEKKYLFKDFVLYFLYGEGEKLQTLVLGRWNIEMWIKSRLKF